MASHVESQMRRAEKLMNAGRKKEALELLRPLTESNPNEPRLWWLIACSAAKPETQKKALEKALRLQPNFPEAQRMLEVVKHLPTGTDAAALKTMELLRAETKETKLSNALIPLVLVVFVLILMLGAGAVFVMQQLNMPTPSTPADPTPSTALMQAFSAITDVPAATPEISANTTAPQAQRIRVENTTAAFSFVLPDGACWAYTENATGGLITCTQAAAILFSVSLNTPYVVEAMNAPEQAEIEVDDQRITAFEGNPFPGIAGGDALWLTTDIDGQIASLLAVTSPHVPDDTLDPYKAALYTLLLSIEWE